MLPKITIAVILLIIIIMYFMMPGSRAKSQSAVVILWFFRPDCGHCTRMSDAWDEFASALPADVAIEKINVTENQELSEDFRVQGVPHIVKVEGDKRTIYSGDRSASDLLKFSNERMSN